METITKLIGRFISLSEKHPTIAISILALIIFILVIFGAVQFVNENIYILGGYFTISFIVVSATIWILNLVKQSLNKQNT